jgi:hypothetical protein
MYRAIALSSLLFFSDCFIYQKIAATNHSAFISEQTKLTVLIKHESTIIMMVDKKLSTPKIKITIKIKK